MVYRGRLFYGGAYLDVKVFTGPEGKYLKYMLPEELVDTSKFLLCPMPGALISLAVKEGDTVEIGQVNTYTTTTTHRIIPPRRIILSCHNLT